MASRRAAATMSAASEFERRWQVPEKRKVGSSRAGMRCGRPNCRCHADPPQLHGPYHQWTREVNGKTVTRLLSDDQLADYQPWFDNQRRLRSLIADLEALSQAIADADPRWHPRSCGRRPVNPWASPPTARIAAAQ